MFDWALFQLCLAQAFILGPPPNSRIMVFLMEKICVISTSKILFLLSHLYFVKFVISLLKNKATLYTTVENGCHLVQHAKCLILKDIYWSQVTITLFKVPFCLWTFCTIPLFSHCSNYCFLSTRSHLLFLSTQWSIVDVGACYINFNKKCQDQITTSSIKLR